VAAQIPLHALGTGLDGPRLRRVLRRLTGRDVSLNEDTTAVLVEALEAISDRLQALERDAASRVRRSQTTT
jgi:hypothetical protein